MKKQSHPSRRKQLAYKKRKKREKIILSIMIPIMLIVLGASVYGAKLLATAEQTIQASYHEVEFERPMEVDPLEDPVAFLLIGVDDNEQRQLGSARADALIYATFNPSTSEVNMVSIPRDTYTEIMMGGEVQQYNRINASYSLGEEKSTIESVENLLDNPIHYYATFNFQGFMEIIDALGGIKVDVPISFSEQDSTGKSNQIHLEAGLQTLNSEEALALARTRKIDNDVKRGERQQLIIEAVLKKGLSIGSIPTYTNLLDAIGNNMRTNMKVEDMYSIIRGGLSDSIAIHTHVFEWTPYERNGASMLQIDPGSLEEIQNLFSESLETSSAVVSDAEPSKLDSSNESRPNE